MHQQFIQLLDSTFYWHIRKAASIEADVEIAELFFASAKCSAGGSTATIHLKDVLDVYYQTDVDPQFPASSLWCNDTQRRRQRMTNRGYHFTKTLLESGGPHGVDEHNDDVVFSCRTLTVSCRTLTVSCRIANCQALTYLHTGAW
eukprot:scaffold1586_cov126-Skeletonema_dohrnii-CCMP3373.AAC.7